jgi:hypothetical protein
MNAHSALMGDPKEKRPLRRPRRRWEDIKMDVREIWWGDMDWIHLAQDRDPVEGCFEHGKETSAFIKCWGILE